MGHYNFWSTYHATLYFLINLSCDTIFFDQPVMRHYIFHSEPVQLLTVSNMYTNIRLEANILTGWRVLKCYTVHRTILVQLDRTTSKKVFIKLRYECYRNRVWILRVSCDLKALLWIVREAWRDMESAMTSHKAIRISQMSRSAQHVQRDTRLGSH